MTDSAEFPADGPPRVLVVEDASLVIELFRRWLPDQGCDCEIATNIADARSLLAGREFDLLLCDMVLPDGSGLQLAGELPERNHGLPVIFLTGHPSVETAIRSVQLRVVAYLVKPPDLGELSQLIRREVAAHRERRIVAASRRHLREWDADLARLEQALEHPERRSGVDYLRLTVAHFAAQLAELDRAIAAMTSGKTGRAALAQLEAVAGLRRAVQVLEKSREHFKSKDLGGLRKELDALLQRVGGDEGAGRGTNSLKD